MKNDTRASTPDALKTVNLLRSLGLMPLPIPRNTKKTDEEKFTDPAFVTDYNRWEKEDLGVGVILSKRYKLVDIDLDEPGIDDLAVAHLPQNGWIFGRKSKRRSHHVFVIADGTDTTQLQREKDPKTKGYMDSEKINNIRLSSQPNDPVSTIIEYRGDGGQTVMPGTVHPSGELVEWHGSAPESLPAAVDSFLLRRSVRKIAFTVMAAKHAWFDGSKHELSLALSGLLANARWKKEEAEHWFQAFLNYAGKGDDRKKVLAAVRDTYRRHEAGERVSGGPTLSEITNCPELVSAFRKMFMDGRESAFDDYNSRYAAGVYFSKVCIFDFSTIDDVDCADFETLSVNDFHLLHSNDAIQVPGPRGKPLWKPKSKVWFEDRRRRTYRSTDFLPGQAKEVGSKLNLWRGWAVSPSSSGSIDRWRHHVSDFICGGDKDAEEWLMAWLADIVQKPMKKPGTAVMMRSGQRSGKNTFIEMMKRVIGIRYVREMNAAGQVTNRFNSHFQYALMMFANEADFASSSAATNTLKTLIADKDFHMEHKNAHAKTGRNFTRVVLASNKLHVIDRDVDDQRYTVLDVVNPYTELGQEGAKKHFDAIYEEIDGVGPSRLLYELQNLKYDPDILRSCYQSEAGRIQTLMSMNPVAQWWAKCVNAGTIRVPEEYFGQIEYRNGSSGWPLTVGKTALEQAFRDQTKNNERLSSALFYQMLYQCSGMDKTSTRQVGSRHDRYRALPLPDLDQCMVLMNEIYNGALGENPEPYPEDALERPIERIDDMEEF